jgi:hypothetical protein
MSKEVAKRRAWISAALCVPPVLFVVLCFVSEFGVAPSASVWTWWSCFGVSIMAGAGCVLKIKMPTDAKCACLSIYVPVMVVLLILLFLMVAGLVFGSWL